MSEMPDLKQLSDAAKDALICKLWPLQLAVKELTDRVYELEIRVKKNSRNSSKPPSTDGLSKPPPKSLREASGRKPGGQPGHKGTTLKCSDTPTQTITHPLPLACEGCGQALDQAAATQLKERRQVFDIPMPSHTITEHRILQVSCTCGQVHRSQFPDDINVPAQYGPTLKALVVDLTQHQMVAVDRAAGLIKDLYSLPLSNGTIINIIKEAADILEPTVHRIAIAITQAQAAGADETGMRVMSKLHWAHALATPKFTWMGVHAKRGCEAIDEFNYIPLFKGILGHDGWMPYRAYTLCDHSLCNTHHVRELRAVGEDTLQVWTEQMVTLLYSANDEVNAAPGRRLSQERIDALRTEYRTIIWAGDALNPVQPSKGKRGRIKQSNATNLLIRLRTYEDDVLRFTFDPNAPFTNNIAEQAIRMNKVKQKVSGCFRTFKGAQAFCTIRSYLATLNKQKMNLFESLVEALRGNVPQPCFS